MKNNTKIVLTINVKLMLSNIYILVFQLLLFLLKGIFILSINLYTYIFRNHIFQELDDYLFVAIGTAISHSNG